MRKIKRLRQARGWRWMLLGLGALGLLALCAVVGLRWWTDRHYRPRIYDVDASPQRSVAIVFGAGYWPSGRLSDILADRVDTAVDLYHAGKVRKLLMTGDNRTVDYNEPGRMLDYALALGVPREDIVLDYAGRRTYDSCYRTRHIFMVEDAILVTQAYHLDRALFTADSLGLDVVGVAADRRDYSLASAYWWRDVLATARAWWDVRIARPLPVLGEQLPIFP
jgi:SanA protein